jgi:hypothetical protein
MKIDINNYEEYFLLYIDNELSKQEKTEVEIFIRENEGFRREFEMLKKTVCIPEGGISLANKSFLFRKEAAFINDQNYEEIFVLYHDKELTANQRLETDRFLLSHPELAAEFELMGKVKLVPESDLVFADKKSLYRKENHGRVIPIIYRFLAAAVFIGFGFWFFINQGNQQVLSDQIVARMSQNDTPTKSIIRKEADPLNDSGLQSEELASAGKSKKKGNVSIKKNYVKPGNKTEIAAITPKEKAEKISKKVSTDFIEQKAAQIVRTGTLKEPIEIIKPVPAINAKEESSTLAVNEETIKAIAVNENNASAISYINPESTNENYIFYNIPAEKFKKSKVGAFLKKIKRVVDRNDPLKLIFSGEEKQVVKN